MVIDIILACLWFITFVVLLSFHFCGRSLEKKLKETRSRLDFVSRSYESEKSRNEMYELKCHILRMEILDLKGKLLDYEK